MLANNLQHGFGVGGLFEGGAEFRFVQEFRDVREGVQVFLELTLRDEKEHDEIHRLIIERVEINTLARAAERADDFGDEIRAGVRDANAETDARAHGGFALFDHGGDGVVMLGFDFAGADEVFDQLVDRLPAVSRLQIGDDLLFRKNIA